MALVDGFDGGCLVLHVDAQEFFHGVSFLLDECVKLTKSVGTQGVMR
jgi:hypothetical protein